MEIQAAVLFTYSFYSFFAFKTTPSNLLGTFLCFLFTRKNFYLNIHSPWTFQNTKGITSNWRLNEILQTFGFASVRGVILAKNLALVIELQDGDDKDMIS